MNVDCESYVVGSPEGFTLLAHCAPTSDAFGDVTNCAALGAQPVRCEPSRWRTPASSRMIACPSMSGPWLTMPVTFKQSSVICEMPANVFSTERTRYARPSPCGPSSTNVPMS